MTDIRLLLLLIIALTGGVMFALPHLSPRGLFFGIRTGTAFRDTGEGRSLVAWYRLWVGLGAAMAAAIVLSLGKSQPLSQPLIALAAMLPELVALTAFGRNYLRVRPHALPQPQIREADLSTDGERLPWWAALAAPPFAIPVAAMLYLREHWDAIPQ